VRVAILRYPEVDAAVMAFFLNFVWEFWQSPWYADVPELSHLDGVILCSKATFGDMVIALGAYSAVTLATRDRFWPRQLTAGRIGGYLAVGLIVTIALEWVATQVLDRWQYGAEMLVIPILGTGLLPILQWILIPLISMLGLRHLWIR